MYIQLRNIRATFTSNVGFCPILTKCLRCLLFYSIFFFFICFLLYVFKFRAFESVSFLLLLSNQLVNMTNYQYSNTCQAYNNKTVDQNNRPAVLPPLQEPSFVKEPRYVMNKPSFLFINIYVTKRHLDQSVITKDLDKVELFFPPFFFFFF
jgi:hypothetical protein